MHPDKLRTLIDTDELIENEYDGIVSLDENAGTLVLQRNDGMHEVFAFRDDAPASFHLATTDGRFLEFVHEVQDYND